MRAGSTLLLLVVACVEDVQLGAPPDGGSLPGLVSLSIAPAAETIELDGLDGPPRRLEYRATGRFGDGAERDVTELVAWRADPPAAGGFVERGVYETTNRAGGHVVVTAESGSIAAEASLTVVVSHTLVDPAYPPPAGATDLFAAPVDDKRPDREPRVVYPANGARAPLDLAPILFQWLPGDGNDASRLSFESDVLHLTVLTGADRWQPDSAIWTLIAHSTSGSTVRLVVAAGATADPTAIFVSPVSDLGVSHASSGGAIWFRTDDGDAIERGAPSDARAARFYPVAPDKTCVSCHAIARDGARIAMGYGGESLRVVDASRNVVLEPDPPRPMGWATFSPDGARLVVADKGSLTLLDAASGAPLGPVPIAGRATHPDWSPAGDSIVVALASTVDNRNMKGGAIATIPFDGASWGEPEILVASTGDNDNNFFPRWSPDGRWIAYVHADSASRGAESAELRLIPSAGGAPIALARASGVGLGSTMPSWSPGGDWIAFASSRPYGHVIPAGGVNHVWIAAIDLALAEAGSDPSFPALWLPAQEPTAMQYAPIWGPPAAAPDP